MYARICPADAILFEDKKSRFKDVLTKRGECVFCGAYYAICPEDAITMLSPDRLVGRFKTIDEGEPSLYTIFLPPMMRWKGYLPMLRAENLNLKVLKLQ